MTTNLKQARLETARATGMRLINIFPKLERRVGLFDTDATPYLVDAGRRASEEKLPQIMSMLDQVPRLLAL
jgi:NTE family protein